MKQEILAVVSVVLAVVALGVACYFIGTGLANHQIQKEMQQKQQIEIEQRRAERKAQIEEMRLAFIPQQNDVSFLEF